MWLPVAQTLNDLDTNQDDPGHTLLSDCETFDQAVSWAKTNGLVCHE
jgi:hypothetical protein